MRTAVFTISGIVYGGSLFVLGFFSAGFGHGVYVPIRVFSSPIWEILHAVIPPMPEYHTFALTVFLLAIVSLWGGAGWLAGRLARRSARISLAVLLAIHYAALPFIFFDGDWSYFPRVWEQLPEIVAMGVSLYLLGQAALWFLLVRSVLAARRRGWHTGGRGGGG